MLLPRLSRFLIRSSRRSDPRSVLVHTATSPYCSICDSKTVVDKSANKVDLDSHGSTKKVKPFTLTTTASTPSPSPPPPADHRQLAIDQELFITSPYSPGSPLFLPNGTRMFNKLTTYLRSQYTNYGFDEVLTPTIYKKSLWEKSGHWENYKDDMFSVIARGTPDTTRLSTEGGTQTAEDEEFGLKPMNCPGHCLLFASKQRSFRDLPIRYADFSPLHRNEISGALSGLTRVRRFHQDDGHIFCRPSQVSAEISETLRFIKTTYETFNLGPYRLALSTRPETGYIGELQDWDRAENALREALENSGQPWTLNPGDGAFYGPKIDIILKDSDGKEHQAATIQLDFQLPNRFDLNYVAPAPELEQKGKSTQDPELLAQQGSVRPVMIHRAVLGSVERFMALLIEHYNGKYPFWLNPRQVKIITVSDDPTIVAFAHETKAILQERSRNPIYTKAIKGLNEENKSYTVREASHAPGHAAFAIDIDDSPRSVGKKVAEAKRNRYGVIIVIGKNDVLGGQWGPLTVDLSGIPHDVRGIFKHLVWKATSKTRGVCDGQGVDEGDGKGVVEHVNLEKVKINFVELRRLMRKMERVYV